MADKELTSKCSANTVTVLQGDVSIGEALANLKSEQAVLGPKLYKQLASTLVAIPCDTTRQGNDQKAALAAIVSFSKTAQDFRQIVGRPMYSVISPISVEIEQDLAKRSLEQDVRKVSQEFKAVDYEYTTTALLAGSLGRLYRENALEYLGRIRSKEEDLANKAKKQ